MESPKKPLKTTTGKKSTPAKKAVEKAPVSKPKSKFVDDDDDEEFESHIDDLGSYDHFDGLADDDDDY